MPDASACYFRPHSKFVTCRARADVLTSNAHPFFGPVAAQHRLAQPHFVVAILRRGEEHGRPTPSDDVLIDGAVVHLVAVGKTLGVAAGVIGEAGDILAEAGGAALGSAAAE